MVRPIIPRRLQIALRRSVARRKRKKVTDSWPILPRAGTSPQGWQGWPDGKRFALILTHDVETRKGHDRCRALMDLDEGLGFRSMFNLVPERYDVSEDLRTEMVARGFEVGVHGLKHDGHLFKNRRTFNTRKQKINGYLKEWGARGFRSPAMLHHSQWIGELDIDYDTSTFDTDPFEPQPNGQETVFPFIVERERGPSYVEMPYTLPQDSTLFVVLGETSPRVWIEKLDWIVSVGGLALINTHPDYMQLNGDERRRFEYPAAHYREFLEHVKAKYAGQYWQGLPRELVADETFTRSLTVRRKPLRICLLGHSLYETDNRKLRSARSLAQRGDHVDAIGLRAPEQERHETIDGVEVFRIQVRKRNERGKWSFASNLLRFLARSFYAVTVRHMRERYDVVSVSSVPDFEVFAAWFAKLTGAKVLLDIYDISPEFFQSKFRNAPGSAFWFKVLLFIERRACSFADHVIAANHLWYDRLVSRAVAAEKCSVFVNYLDPTIFYRHPRTRDDDRIIIIYPGTFNYHQGVDISVRAFAEVKKRFPKAEFHLYGAGANEAWLKSIAAELKISDSVVFNGCVPMADVPGIMANADLGVVGKRSDVFGNEAYSTKILEYMSQGLPVVVPRTRIDDHYFNDSVVRFFEPGNYEAMAASMVELLENPEMRARQVQNAFEYVSRAEDWEQKQHDYLKTVDELTLH